MFYDQLTAKEVVHFCGELTTGRFRLHFMKMLHDFSTRYPDEAVSLTERITEIITQRDPQTDESSDIDIKSAPSLFKLPSPLIGETASFLAQRSYSNLSKTCRTVFLACNEPNTLRQICVMNPCGCPRMPHLQRLTMLMEKKSLGSDFLDVPFDLKDNGLDLSIIPEMYCETTGWLLSPINLCPRRDHNFSKFLSHFVGLSFLVIAMRRKFSDLNIAAKSVLSNLEGVCLCRNFEAKLMKRYSDKWRYMEVYDAAVSKLELMFISQAVAPTFDRLEQIRMIGCSSQTVKYFLKRKRNLQLLTHFELSKCRFFSGSQPANTILRILDQCNGLRVLQIRPESRTELEAFLKGMSVALQDKKVGATEAIVVELFGVNAPYKRQQDRICNLLFRIATLVNRTRKLKPFTLRLKLTKRVDAAAELCRLTLEKMIYGGKELVYIKTTTLFISNASTEERQSDYNPVWRFEKYNV